MTTSKEQPHAITAKSSGPGFNVKQPLRSDHWHLSTSYNEQLSSPQPALAMENNLPERTATRRISKNYCWDRTILHNRENLAV